MLLRFPGVFAAVTASAIILAASAAAGPVFESSVGADAVNTGLQGRTGEGLAVRTHGLLAADVIAFQQHELVRGVAGIGLSDPVITLLADGVRIRPAAASRSAHQGGRAAKLVARTGFLDHVSILAGAGQTNGVWLPESTATAVGIDPGQQAVIGIGGRSVSVPVAGIYRDLFVGRLDPFWATVSSDILPSRPGEAPPPPAVLASPDLFLQIAARLEASGIYSWGFGLGASTKGSIGLDRAVVLAVRMRGVLERLQRPENPLGAALQAPAASSPIVGIAERAQATVNGIAGPVRTFSFAAEAVALVGLIASAVYGIRRRRIEVRMLDALGASATRLGLSAGAESVLPVLVGTAVGVSVALAGVRSAGPSSTIDGSAIHAAVVDAIASAVLAVVVFTGAAAGAVRIQVSDASEGRVRNIAAMFPWEAPVIALAAAAIYEIWNRGTGPVAGASGTVRIDRLILLFPILFITGLAGLVVRGIKPALSVISRRADRWPTPAYLASRRLTSAPRAALLLMTAASLAAGVLLYATSIVATIRSATTDKARLGIGADVSATIPAIFSFPSARGIEATNVITLSGVLSSGRHVSLIGVERSLPNVALWDPGYASEPLTQLVSSLEASSGVLPAISVGGGSDREPTLVLGGFQVPLRVVASVRAFPGQSPTETLVVSIPALQAVLSSHGISVSSLGTEYHAWVRGQPRAAVAYLTGLGVPLESITTARSIAEAPEFRALASAFAYMRLLGILTVLVALIGILLYLQSRQRSRSISYALSHRMGLSAGTQRVAVAFEIAAILGVALVVGTTLAFVAAAMTYAWLDPMPALPPAPALHLSVAAAGVLALGIVVVSATGAWLVQRSTGRMNLAEVLRYAD